MLGQSRRKLNPLALAVLGLLHERPMHPYEIAFEMRTRHLEEHIKLNFGTLYHTVENLQSAGWVEPVETGRSGGRPERTVYRLTDGGSAAFLDTLSDLLSQPAREYSAFEAGLAFIERLGRDEALRMLRTRCDAIRNDVAGRRGVLEELRQKGLPRLWVIENEHALMAREAELRWLERVCQEIEDGRLEWASVNDSLRDDHPWALERRELVKGVKGNGTNTR